MRVISFFIASMFAATGGEALAQSPDRIPVLQLSLKNSGGSEADARRKMMAEETAKITSCREAFELPDRFKARGMHGELNAHFNSNLPTAALPDAIRTALLARPVGRATPLYGGADVLRVLIRCEPGFQVPPKALQPHVSRLRSGWQ
jgi:hypothetical protein